MISTIKPKYLVINTGYMDRFTMDMFDRFNKECDRVHGSRIIMTVVLSQSSALAVNTFGETVTEKEFKIAMELTKVLLPHTGFVVMRLHSSTPPCSSSVAAMYIDMFKSGGDHGYCGCLHFDTYAYATNCMITSHEEVVHVISIDCESG